MKKDQFSEAVDLKMIEGLIEREPQHKADVAKMLFPNNKFPMIALSRVLNGKAEISAQQLKTLSNYFHVSLSDFYGCNGWKIFECDKWKAAPEQGKWAYRKGDYTATLDLSEGKTTVFYTGSEKAPFEEVFYHAKTVTIFEYTEMLNSIISKHHENHPNI